MEFSLEQKFAMATSALFGNAGNIAKAVDDKFGAAGRDVLRQVMSKDGAAMGEWLKPMCPGKDFKSVGTFLPQAMTMLGVENEVKPNEEGVTITGSKCPYGLEGTNRELCEAMMAFVEAAASTISPDVTIEITKTVAAGDPLCQFSFKARK